MNKKLSFKKFVKEYGEKGIFTVASDYATLADSVTIYVLSEKYNISKGAVRSAIRYAVENCLVSYSVANKMKEKAHRNQKRHSEDSDSIPTSSDKYYDRLFESRDSKIIESMNGQMDEVTKKMDEYKVKLDEFKSTHPVTFEDLKKKEALEKEFRKFKLILSDFLKKV